MSSNNYIANDVTLEFLEHHGTKGMHWGDRKYQNPDGTLTPAGRLRYGVGSSRGRQLGGNGFGSGSSIIDTPENRKRIKNEYLDSRADRVLNRVKYNPQSFGDKVFKRGDSRKVKERDKYERIGLERFKNQVASNMVSSSGKPIKTREDRERAIKEAKAEMNDRALDNAYQDAEYLYSKYSSNAHKRGKDLTDDDIKMKREYSQEYNEGDAFVNAVFDAVEKQMEEYTNDHTVKTKEQEEKEKQESEKKKNKSKETKKRRNRKKRLRILLNEKLRRLKRP